jgi:flagellar biogenesis protein FliO
VAEPAFAFGELVKLVFALGVTIGLFYALALFMKRMQVGTGKNGTLITVLAAQPLGGKEKIWVLDIAGEKLVVGTSPGTVNCLHVLKDVTGELASFPRKRESSDVELQGTEGLDSRPPPSRGQAPTAGNDEVASSDAARGFSELLTKFRGWQKP